MAMKFRAHDTFFIRKGWLSKGMKHVRNKPHVFVDKEENPMDLLGIGSNMVKALRYWLQAVGLTEEPRSGRRDQSLTVFGSCVFEHDRFIEEIGTLYLLHYKLATNKEDATFLMLELVAKSVSHTFMIDFARPNVILVSGKA